MGDLLKLGEIVAGLGGNGVGVSIDVWGDVAQVEEAPCVGNRGLTHQRPPHDGSRNGLAGARIDYLPLDAHRLLELEGEGGSFLEVDLLEGGGPLAETNSHPHLTELDALDWAGEVERLGAGEILLTSMDTDGTKGGYDIELTSGVSERLSVPVIASGGAGALAHMAEVLKRGKADAVLAASIFHFGEYTVDDVKRYLSKAGLPMRLC